LASTKHLRSKRGLLENSRPDGDCVRWNGYVDDSGYGRIYRLGAPVNVAKDYVTARRSDEPRQRRRKMPYANNIKSKPCATLGCKGKVMTDEAHRGFNATGKNGKIICPDCKVAEIYERYGL